MICPPCKKAGTMATVGYSKTEVTLAHQKCEAPATCPCHHKPETIANQTNA